MAKPSDNTSHIVNGMDEFENTVQYNQLQSEMVKEIAVGREW